MVKIGLKICKEQHAFVQKRALDHPAIGKSDNLTINFNKGEKTAAVFLDVEKAFDRVFLHKIHHMGTHPNISKLIDCFLDKKTFRVRQDNFCFPVAGCSPRLMSLADPISDLYK